MAIALLIIFSVAFVITAIYETLLLRTGRGSWQALVSGVLASGAFTISAIARIQDQESLGQAASLIAICSLIWHTIATRRRHRRPKPGLGLDHNAV